jgi:hypothetical protein
MSYKINYFISFMFSKIIPIFFLFYVAQKFSEADYVQIEYILAFSLFLSTFLNFGMNGIPNIVKANNIVKGVRARHSQIFSLLNIFLSIIFFFLQNFFLSLLFSITSSLIISQSIVNDLKLEKLKIKVNFFEPIIYYILVISLIIDFFTNSIEFKYICSILFLITASALLIINIKKYGLNFFIQIKFSKLIKIYSISLNYFFFGIVLILLSIYPRLFVNFLDENEKFNYLFSFRIAFLSFFIHQIFTNYFHYDFFKGDINKFNIISKLAIFLTFLSSIFFVYTYNFFVKIEFLNFKYIYFNNLIFLQIIFLSAASYYNILILRSKNLHNLKNLFLYLIIISYFFSYILLNFYKNHENILILMHSFILFLYILIVILKKENDKKIF